MTITEFINLHCKGRNNVIKANTASIEWWTKNNFLSWLEKINDLVPFLSENATFRQKVYHIENSIFEKKLCDCGKERNWQSNLGKYSTYCSNSCASIYTKKQRQETCMSRYGVENPAKSNEIKEKIKEKMINTYGVDNYSKTDEFSNLMKNQWAEYTHKERSEIREKTKKTCQTKYSADSPLESTIIKQKIKDTLLDKFGVDSPLKNKEILKKQQATMISKFNRVNYQQLHISEEHIENLKNKDWVSSQLDIISPRQLGHQVNMSYAHICKIIAGHGLTNIQISSFHREISLFLESLGESVVENTKHVLPSKKELDIYVNDKNIAIECNGIYWHSEISGRKPPDYHATKTKEANSLGITLLHITDLNWYDETKNSILKSKITHLCHKTPEIIFARSCKVVKVNTKIAREFLNKNHIQGYAPASICYGLEYQGDLKMIMSFSKPRYSTKYQWELIRSSAKNFTSIVGGFSKLLARFKKEFNPETIISYCNRDWSIGNVYQKNNFVKINETSQACYYHKHDGKLINRLKFQKHKLSKVLKSFDPTKSAWDNISENGYDRIWDSGNLVYLWERPQVDNKSNT
jgi:hypothetical protein